MSSLNKVFNDSVHGSIELNSLLVKIIDTPAFQRLRNIKQLGLAYLVYPGASHNRFEHSIGTAHLAGKLVRMLKQKQGEELGITDKDILCVEIAGLCHDLGHGPFSHLFDGLFLPKVSSQGGICWQHEKGSCDMFDYILKDANIKKAFEEAKMTEDDVSFIKEMIYGPLSDKSHKDWPYRGRPEEKGFLYEIISNKRNGVDVDKWDYFARDCHHLGVHNTFQADRFMQCLRVLKDCDGKLTICARDKEFMNLFEMFRTRSVLHRKAYQHKVVKLIEEMASEALVKANDFIEIPGENGKTYRMSEAIEHPDACVNLTDDVWGQIMRSTDGTLEESKEILTRIMSRDLYYEVKKWEYLEKVEAETLEKDIKKQNPGNENFVLVKTSIDFGGKDKSPLENYWFYKKQHPDKCFKIETNTASTMLPKKFQEFTVIVYSKVKEGKQIFGSIEAKRRKTSE